MLRTYSSCRAIIIARHWYLTVNTIVLAWRDKWRLLSIHSRATVSPIQAHGGMADTPVGSWDLDPEIAMLSFSGRGSHGSVLPQAAWFPCKNTLEMVCELQCGALSDGQLSFCSVSPGSNWKHQLFRSTVVVREEKASINHALIVTELESPKVPSTAFCWCKGAGHSLGLQRQRLQAVQRDWV